MTIILDNITIPEKGVFELNISVEINITAEQARKKIDHWLMDQVSTQMGAETPTLVIGEHPVWRVPAYISFPDTGPIRGIGTYDVDVDTGEILDLEAQLEKMMEYLEVEVKPRLKPYQPKTREVPPEYLPKDVPRAKRLVLKDDGSLESVG